MTYIPPPSGWYTFGTHAGWDGKDIPPLEFSEETDEALMPLFERPAKQMCGGCAGMGNHKRWCRNKVGLSASVYGPMAEQLESMGDRVGPNNMGLSNKLWALSAEMRAYAEALRDEYESKEN